MNYVSTDVDRILEYVKNRRKAELVEVARALDLRAVNVDKWAKILEKQGLLSIQYDLTKMYLVWKEPQAKPDAIGKYVEEIEKKQPVFPEVPKKPGKEDQKPALLQAVNKKDSDIVHGGAFGLFMLGRKSDLKKPDTTMQKEDSALKTTQKALIPAQTVPKKSDEKKEKIDAIPLSGPVPEKTIAFSSSHSQSLSKPSFVLPFFSRPAAPAQSSGLDAPQASPASQQLKSNVDAINATIAEIADLKAEREKLYTTGYVPLISRLNSQISALSDKASEKENTLLNLRKRMAELSDKITRTEAELQDSLKKIQEMEASYSKQLESLSQLRKLSQKCQDEIGSLRTEVERGYVDRYLSEIKKINQQYEQDASELSSKDENIEMRMKLARDRLQQLLKESRVLSKKFDEDV